MKKRMLGKSTRMDRQGKVYLPEIIRRRAGLKPGLVEFVQNDRGDFVIRNVLVNKKK